MNVVIYRNPARREQHGWLDALSAGFARHGLSAETVDHRQPLDCDLAVFWAHKHDAVIEHQRARGCDYLVIERGYLGDRMRKWCSLGFNGLNGRADFVNRDVPADRGKQWRHLLKPFRFGSQTLVMGQVPGDRAVDGLDVASWADSAADEAAKRVSKPVRVRPHPVCAIRTRTAQTSGSLADDLASAHWVITYNSNSGVDAALEGVPVVTMDRGSMAWDVAAHEIEYRVASDSARQRWLDRLAYCQWTQQEIRNGCAWDHLQARYR